MCWVACDVKIWYIWRVMAETQEKNLTESEEDKNWSVAFDMGREMGFEEGKEIGRKEAFDMIADRFFYDKFDLSNTIQCAETFIKRFNESFADYSIASARIGVAPSSSIPTAFFVLDVPENISDEDDNRIDALKREVELSFAKRNPGHPVCVWSVEKSSVDMNSVESDFPFYRKIV